MPNVPDRAKLEADLAAAIGDALNGKSADLIAALGDPPSLDNVPDDFWTELGDDLTAVIQPKLQKIFAEQGKAVANHVKYESVDWTLVNKTAADWAKDYTFELIKGINQTSRDKVSAVITSFFENQQTVGDMEDALQAIFGAYRAALIATTEVTRASVQGELSTVNQIEEDSKSRMVPTFQTSEDEIVCDECDPLDGQEVTEENYPPIHPGCRCLLAWDFAKEEA